jgi:hypothetical protein
LEGKEQEMIRKHFRIRRYVFGLAFVAALIAPAAAQAVSGVMTDGPATGVQQTDARHAALLSNKTVAPASPLSAQPTGIGQQAYAARMQAMADAYKRMQSQPTSIGQQAYGARLQATADRYASIGQGPVRSENSFGAPGQRELVERLPLERRRDRCRRRVRHRPPAGDGGRSWSAIPLAPGRHGSGKRIDVNDSSSKGAGPYKGPALLAAE